MRKNGKKSAVPEILYLTAAEPWLHTLREGYYAVTRSKKAELKVLRKDLFMTLLQATSHLEVPPLCHSLHLSLVQSISLLTAYVFNLFAATPSSGQGLARLSEHLKLIDMQLDRLHEWQVIDGKTHLRLTSGEAPTLRFSSAELRGFHVKKAGTHGD